MQLLLIRSGSCYPQAFDVVASFKTVTLRKNSMIYLAVDQSDEINQGMCIGKTLS